MNIWETIKQDKSWWWLMGLLAFIIGLALLPVQPYSSSKQESVRAKEVVSDTNQPLFQKVYHFEYKGHKYIKFLRSGGVGVIHDPNCPCHKVKK